MTDQETTERRKAEARAMMAEVKANQAKLDSCMRHRFDPATYRPFGRMTCTRCGGVMAATAIFDYIKGYEAAGCRAETIWRGFRSMLPREGGRPRKDAR